MRDDMAVPASVPDKAFKAALTALRDDPELQGVEWDVPRRKGNRPHKIFFQADDAALLRRAKDTLERLLADAGHPLY
ncbi:hypothetical protein [Deinococcus pimensis]|uniref:hypothetical protein n=1 Tax=Deinococcus pimensis TaxID=309888 RepID=UPI0005EAD26D|nr:hypothetical protein [Deinococcus pimensis]